MAFCAKITLMAETKIQSDRDEQAGFWAGGDTSEETADQGLEAVTWTASEYIAHDKTASWYVILAVVAVALAALVFLITRDYISIAVVVVAALMIGTYGSHKPRQLEYRLDSHGFSIGPKAYSYQDYRSFAVMPEEAFKSIVFMPLKRFAAPITIYYAPEDEQKIMAILSRELPFEEQRRDAIDRLMKRIRF